MSNSDIFTPSLSRTIVQVQFRPTLPWLTGKATAAHLLEKKYKEWVANKDGDISLYSPDEKQALEVFTRNTTSVSEGDFKFVEEGIKHIKTILNQAITKDGVEEIRRVACRQTIVFESTISFSEITDHIYKKLFSTGHSLQEGTVKDLAYVLDTINDDKVKTHTQIGAVDKKQTIQDFASKFEEDVTVTSDNNLFFDIDVSITEGLNKTNIDAKIDLVVSICTKTIKEYLAFLEA